MRSLVMAVLAGLALMGSFAMAGPGAHGPNGEHLDAPMGGFGAPARPRVVAHSETFELVAELQDGTLSIILDHHDTNEPVLGASVEIESAGIKAMALFREAQGDYALEPGDLLSLLQKPGEHALVFTIVAGADADLLDGVLVNTQPPTAHDHDAPSFFRWALLIAGAMALGGLALLVWRRTRGRARSAALAAGVQRTVLPMLLLSAMVPVIAGPGAHGPNGEHLDAPASPLTASSLARLPDGSVNVPKHAQRRMGIRTVVAPVTDAAFTVELPGRVVVDPNAGGRVQAVHGGRLEAGPRGLPVAGQRVVRGEVLAYVRHHAEPYAVGAQQAQLADLQAQRRLAQQRLVRLESLEGTVPRKEIEAAREEATSLVERETRIAHSLTAREALTSPVDGVVARAEAVLGQVVEARDVVFEVVDPHRLLVEATTADPVLAGRVAEATVQGVEGVQLTLLGAARVLRDGVLPLTFAARPTGDLKTLPLAVGQPVMVLAQTRERVKGIVLPAQAVVRNPSNEPVVWIKSGPERFIPQPIQYRFLDARTVVVSSGLAADNRVVMQGASLIAQIR